MRIDIQEATKSECDHNGLSSEEAAMLVSINGTLTAWCDEHGTAHLVEPRRFLTVSTSAIEEAANASARVINSIAVDLAEREGPERIRICGCTVKVGDAIIASAKGPEGVEEVVGFIGRVEKIEMDGAPSEGSRPYIGIHLNNSHDVVKIYRDEIRMLDVIDGVWPTTEELLRMIERRMMEVLGRD